MKIQFIQNLIQTNYYFGTTMLTNILVKVSRIMLNEPMTAAMKYQYSQSQLKDTDPKLFQVLSNAQKTSYLEKAYLAGKIIQIIKNPPQSILQTSLKDQILGFVDDDEFASNSSKTQVSKMFTEGVILPFIIYRQARVQYAKIIDSQKVIFHPTHFVTGEAFEAIQNNQNAYLFTGHYGISKTISTIFYQKLSDFVMDYKFRIQDDPFNQTKLFQKIPKLLYWSINMEEDTDQIVKRLLNFQFLDIQKKYLNELDQNIKNSRLREKYFYKNIKVQLVVDQLQSLISQVRSKGYQCNEENRTNPQFKKIIEIDNIIKNYHQQMSKIFFLTSNNSQLYLKDHLSLCSNQNKVTDLLQRRIIFHQLLKNKQNKIQLIDFFLNCLNQTIISNVKKLMANSEKTKYQLDTKQFYNKVRTLILFQFDNESIFYINQYTIRMFFLRLDSRKKKQIEQKMCTSYEDLENQTVKLFKQAYFRMVDQLSKKVHQFLNNNSPDKIVKHLLMIEFYDKFMQNKEQGFSDSTLVKIQYQKLKILQKQSYQTVLKLLDRHLFEIDQQKDITCIIPPSIFFKLKTKDQTETYLSYVAKQIGKFSSEVLVRFIAKGSGQGTTVQKIFKILLTKGNTQIRIFDNFRTQLNKFQNIFAGASTFKGIPRVLSGNITTPYNIHKQYSLLDSLKDGLKDMIQTTKDVDQRTNRIFFSVKNKFSNISTLNKQGYEQFEEITDSTSKDIDFILVNYEKNKRKINLNGLDITIYKQTKKIQNKMEKFLKNYKLFLDKQKNKIQIDGNSYEVCLNYYVASLKQNDQSTMNALKSALFNQRIQMQFFQVQNATQMVRNQDNNNELLNQIGFLCLNQNITIGNQNLRVIQPYILQNILKSIKNQLEKKRILRT